MTIKSRIKTGDGIDGLVSEYTTQSIEEPKDLNIGQTVFDSLNQHFEAMLAIEPKDPTLHRLKKRVYARRNIDAVLTPDQIQIYMNSTIRHESHEGYSLAFDVLFKRFIENSYAAGNNNFFIDTTYLIFESLVSMLSNSSVASNLVGSYDNPLYVTLNTNGAEYVGNGSKNCIYTINVGRRSSKIGNNAESCVFDINGHVLSGSGENSKSCLFKVRSRKAVRNLLKGILESRSNSVIEYIDSNGKVKVVKG